MKISSKISWMLLLWATTHVQADDFVAVLQDGRDGFRGTRDATVSVDPRVSDVSLGADSELGIWQFDGTVFIKFDFDYSDIPADASVKAASLELYCVSVGFSEEEIKRPWQVGIFECSADWREGSGTPNKKVRDGVNLATSNGRDPWHMGSHVAAAGKALGTATIQGRRQWYKWSLDPRLVADWIAGHRDNHGLLIWGKAPGKAVSFASREWPSVAQRPILRLQLSLPPEEIKSLQQTAVVHRIDAAKPDHLVPKATYRLSKETVMMPHYDVKKAIELGTPIKKRPAGSTITILFKKLRPRPNRVWYKVATKGNHGQGSEEGWINSLAFGGQELDIVAEAELRVPEPKHLGVSRSTAVRLFKQVDSKIQFSRDRPVLGQPLQVGTAETVHVNLVGPSEDLVEVAFSFDAKAPRTFAMDDAMPGRLIGELQPKWPEAIAWIEAQLARAKVETFSEVRLENGNAVLGVERIRNDAFVTLEANAWRNQKAAD